MSNTKKKLHHMKFVSASTLFQGLTSVGTVFGTTLSQLGASLTPRVALERHWISPRNYSATIAVVETQVRAPRTEVQVMNLRNWLAARRLISAILSEVVPLEPGFPRYEAARMLLKAGLIEELTDTMSEKHSPDGEHAHRIPVGEIKEALEWFAHTSRVENQGLQFIKKPWDLPWERVQPETIKDEESGQRIPNPDAGKPYPVTRAYLQEIITAIRTLEDFTVEGALAKGPLIFDLVPGPLLPLASCTPTPDGMELQRGQMKPMRNRQFVSLVNYTHGTVYVLKLTVLENRATVLVAVPDVYRGEGKKDPVTNKVDWSKQERLQKGVGRKEAGRWALTWQTMPPNRRIMRGTEELFCWQPFAQYESGAGKDRLSGHLTAFLKRIQLDALGVIGLSWLQNMGTAEVVIGYVNQHEIGAEMLQDLHAEMVEENSRQVSSRQLAHLAVAATSKVATPELVEEKTAQLAEAGGATTAAEATEEQASAMEQALQANLPPEVEQEQGDDQAEGQVEPVMEVLAQVEEPASAESTEEPEVPAEDAAEAEAPAQTAVLV